MAGVTILQLPQAVGLTGNEQIEGVQNNTSVRIALGTIAATLGITGPAGPVGPVGPIGPIGPAGPAGPTSPFPTTTSAETAAGITPSNTAYSELDIRRYGAICNGIADDFAALLSAVSVAAQSTANALIYVPGPTLIGSNLTIGSPISILPPGLKIANGVALTLNCPVQAGSWQIFDISLGGTISGAPIVNDILVDWFGYSATDNSAQFVAAAKLARTAGNIPVRMLGKTYKVLSNIFGAGANTTSFNYPSWIGAGKNKTVIDGSGITSGSVLKFRGGSGLPLSDTVLQGFKVLGNSSTNGIEIAGCGGFRVRDVMYDTHASGQLFHNEDTGSFTEFNKLEDCEWRNCTTEIELRRTLGNDSFNSTGCQYGCIASLPVVASHAVVTIGSGCKPYNSPFNIHVQGNGASATVFRNNSTSLESVRGEVTFEMGNSTLTQADTNPLTGGIRWIGTGNSVERGTYIEARDLLLGSSAVVPLGARWAGTIGLSAGATTITSPINLYTRQVVLAIRGPSSYDVRTIMQVDGASPGTFKIPGTDSFYDQTSVGAVGLPSLTVDGSGNLVITNANYTSGFNAYIEETQIGGTRLHF